MVQVSRLEHHLEVMLEHWPAGSPPVRVTIFISPCGLDVIATEVDVYRKWTWDELIVPGAGALARGEDV